MKIVFMLLLLVSALYSQSLEISFTNPGVDNFTTQTGHLIADPSSASDFKSIVKQQSESEASEKSNFGIGVETFVNEDVKYVTIPLQYTISNFVLKAEVPYIFNKKLNYFEDSAEASGIGDIRFSISYNTLFNEIFFSITPGIKFPTGDYDSTDGNLLVPLGTGSMDYTFSIHLLKDFTETFGLEGGFFTKFNGTSEKKAEIINEEDPAQNQIIDYEITNGAIFKFDVCGNYYFMDNMTFALNTGLTVMTEGSKDKTITYTDGSSDKLTDLSNEQDGLYLDISPYITYRFLRLNLTAGVSIPVFTQRNDNNTEDDRTISLFTKINF
ncbi:MAG: transporter [Candidatus Delongbacteria bacterium]|nr:transporter [Candidatus Delongbacteria bacterium]MBN2835596.1 transporter [Candidatus Delongbacteria bacterium]